MYLHAKLLYPCMRCTDNIRIASSILEVYSILYTVLEVYSILEAIRTGVVSFPDPPWKIEKFKGSGNTMAMLCLRGIQSVTQSRVNVYTRGDDWSCAPLIAACTVLSLT